MTLGEKCGRFEAVWMEYDEKVGGINVGEKAREAVLEYILSIRWGCHSPSVSADEMPENRVYEVLTDEYHLGYKGDQGGFSSRRFRDQ